MINYVIVNDHGNHWYSLSKSLIVKKPINTINNKMFTFFNYGSLCGLLVAKLLHHMLGYFNLVYFCFKLL